MQRSGVTQGLELQQIALRDVDLYLDSRPRSAGTKKVEFAALRHFFDQLVTRHAVMLNRATSVR